MKQHTIAPGTTTKHKSLSRAPLLVAATAVAIVGSLITAPIAARA